MKPLRGSELVINYLCIWLMAMLRRPIIHIQLTDCFLATYLFFRACKLAGLRVDVTCHDVIEHDGTLPRRRYSIFCRADRLIVHTRAAVGMLTRVLGGADPRICTYPYPAASYVPILSPAAVEPKQREIRRMLDPSRVWFLLIGYIRNDKGVDTLCEAWKYLGESTKCGLLVVGKWPPGMFGLKARLEAEDDVVVMDARVDDGEFVAYLREVDYVVLPYREYAHSAILYSAAYSNCAVVVSDIELFTELLPGYPYTFRTGDAKDLASVMKKVAGAPKSEAEVMAGMLRRAVDDNMARLPKRLRELRHTLYA